MTLITRSTPGVTAPMDTEAGLMPTPANENFDPSIWAVIGASFGQQNVTLGLGRSLYGSIASDRGPYLDPYEVVDPSKAYSATANPLRYLAGYEDFLSNFGEANTAAGIANVKAQIDRELRNRRILAERLWTGFFGQLAAGAIDPVMFLPIAGGAAKVKGATGLVQGIMRGATGGAGYGAVHELLITPTQQTRALPENLETVAGGAILGGLIGGAIGGAIHWMSPQQIKVASAKLEDITAVAKPPVAPEAAAAPMPAPAAEPVTAPVPAAEPAAATSDVAGLSWRDLQARARAAGVKPFQKRPALEAAVAEAEAGKAPAVAAPAEPIVGGVRLLQTPSGDPVARIRLLSHQGRGMGTYEVVEWLQGGTEKMPASEQTYRHHFESRTDMRLISSVDRRVVREGAPLGYIQLMAGDVKYLGPIEAPTLAVRSPVAEGIPALTASNSQVIAGHAPDPLEPGGIEVPRMLPAPSGPITVTVTKDGRFRWRLVGRSAGGETSTVRVEGGKPSYTNALEIVQSDWRSRHEEFPGVKAQAVNSTTTVQQIAQAAGAPEVATSGLNKIAKYLAPRMRPAHSALAATRRIAQRLISVPVRLKGDVVAGDAAEVAARLEQARWRTTRQKVMDLYVQHSTGDPNAAVKMRHVLFGFGRRAGKMSYQEFDEQIAKAMRGEPGPEGTAINVDQHPVAEVESAARLYRAQVVNRYRDMAIDMEMLSPETREFSGYLTRMMNHDLLRQPGERDKFIDSVIAYEQKVALGKGAVEEFNEAKARASLGKYIDTVLKTPEGRMFPGDVGLRTPVLERMLKVPDAVIERWIVRSAERTIAYYVRAMTGDLEIVRRFGLVTQRERIYGSESRMLTDMKAAREAVAEGKDPDAASAKVVREMRSALADSIGGKKFRRVLLNGSERRGILGPKSLAKAVRVAETEADAAKVLHDQHSKLIQQFSTGSMELALDEVATRWNRRMKVAERTSGQEARSLQKQRNADLFYLRLARDHIRGMAALPADPTAILPRVLRGARMWTLMAVGGKLAAASVPDLAGPILNHGLVDPRGLGGFFRALLTDWGSVKLAIADAEAALGPSEVLTNLRVSTFTELEDQFAYSTRVEKGLEWGVRKFSLVNLMGPWSQAMRNLSSLTVQTFVTRSARALAAGDELSPVISGRLAELGLSKAMLLRIAAARAAAVGKGGRVADMVLGLDRWTDEGAATATKAAIYRAYDLNIMHGGMLDRPALWRVPGLGDELSKTFFMFLNFGFAANTRILVRGLQWHDASFATGAALSVGLGVLSQWLKYQASGNPTPPADNLAGWVKLGIEQSGISGTFFDVDRVLDRVSGGYVGLSRIAPGSQTRAYTPDSVVGALFGPVAGSVANALRVTGDLAGFDLAPGTIQPENVRRLRRLLIMQNHFATFKAFDALQDKVAPPAR